MGGNLVEELKSEKIFFWRQYESRVMKDKWELAEEWAEQCTICFHKGKRRPDTASPCGASKPISRAGRTQCAGSGERNVQVSGDFGAETMCRVG